VSELPEDETGTPRQRYRAQIREEIKQAALRQLAQFGPAGISVNAIGKELGVSGPALYRYFASRDELLTELVIDAYIDLGDALRASIEQIPARSHRRRFETLARGYRSWALAEPHRYRLLFGPPLPGFDAHADRLNRAANASMELLVDTLPNPTTRWRPGAALAEQLSLWADIGGFQVQPSNGLRAVLSWAHVHGFVSLEIAGNYTSMGLDPDLLFEAELRALWG
jgi:AcrR family transcriptional regulator